MESLYYVVSMIAILADQILLTDQRYVDGRGQSLYHERILKKDEIVTFIK